MSANHLDIDTISKRIHSDLRKADSSAGTMQAYRDLLETVEEEARDRFIISLAVEFATEHKSPSCDAIKRLRARMVQTAKVSETCGSWTVKLVEGLKVGDIKAANLPCKGAIPAHWYVVAMSEEDTAKLREQEAKRRKDAAEEKLNKEVEKKLAESGTYTSETIGEVPPEKQEHILRDAFVTLRKMAEASHPDVHARFTSFAMSECCDMLDDMGMRKVGIATAIRNRLTSLLDSVGNIIDGEATELPSLPAPTVKASPKALAILADAGIDPTTVDGTGKDGTITVNDARKAVKAAMAA